jgi:hypothetical protein
VRILPYERYPPFFFNGGKRASSLLPAFSSLSLLASRYLSSTGTPSGWTATHLASAIYAKCDYFITTDDRLLKYATDKIKIVNPVQFITEEE